MTRLLDPDRLLDVLGSEGEAIARAVHGAHLDAVVPHCPGLTLGETVRHVAGVYHNAMTWIRDGGKPGNWPRTPRSGQQLTDFLLSTLTELEGLLRSHDPDERCASPWPHNETYGFWRRRLAHETVVHRVDVQGAAGGPVAPVGDEVAVDGIDDVLTYWFGYRLGELGLTGTKEATVGVRAGPWNWLALSGPDGSTVRQVEPAEAEAADALVSGDPEDIYLWLWGRRFGRAKTEGDYDAAAQLWALLRLATR